MIIFFHPVLAENQIQIQEGEVSVETSPNNPQPYQDVVINLISYATDLDKAIITWEISGRTVLSGIGKKSYSFKAGAPDTLNVINISIKPVSSMSTINKTITIVPTEVDIMWEAVNSYTPPFYKGKAFPVVGSMIKVVAIPNTKTILSGSGSMSYVWKNNDIVDSDSSGYNKNSYLFKNSVFENTSEIGVIVSSVSGNFGAENTVSIPMYEPSLIFYKKSPTEGVLYNQALNKEIEMPEDEMTIVAEPYFTSFKGKEDNFMLNWTINENIIPTPSKKTELTIRPSARGGYATIGLVMENTKELFQKISNQLRINL